MSERLARHEQLRSIGEAVGESVRLLAENAADGHCRIADGDLAADVEIEPVEQRALDEHDTGIAPQRPWLLGSGDRDVAVKRIGVVDGFDLDQRALAFGRAGHGAEARRFAHLAQGFERRPLGAVGLAVDQLEGEIAADEQPPLPRQCLVERGRKRADGGDGGDAEGDAQHENGEPAGAGAQLPQGDGQGKRKL
jgi:hypothetical protein